MNPHMKYWGFIAKTVPCGLVTMSDGPIFNSKWPVVTSNLKQFTPISIAFFFRKMNPQVKYSGSIDKTVFGRLLMLSDNPISKSKWPVVTWNLKRCTTNVIPLITMNHHVKYCGFNAKTVACRLVTMSDGPISKSKWPVVTSNLKQFTPISIAFILFPRWIPKWII